MSIHVIQDVAADGNGGLVEVKNLLIDSEEDLNNAPPVAPGSMAIQSDGKYMAVWNGEEWKAWLQSGGDE